MVIDDLPSLDEREVAIFELARRAGVVLEPFVDQFRYMSPAELFGIANNGIRIELHTHRHQSVNRIDSDLPKEIQDNYEALVSLGLTREFRHFCYPSGDTVAGVDTILATLGIASATTTRRQINPPKCNPYFLGRLLDGHRVSQLDFEAYLSGALQLTDFQRASIF